MKIQGLLGIVSLGIVLLEAIPRPHKKRWRLYLETRTVEEEKEVMQHFDKMSLLCLFSLVSVSIPVSSFLC